MDCPTDGATLVMSERQGIEIDYCPQCRGVWLDRGELDKIIERSANEERTAFERGRSERYDDDDRRRYEHRSHDDDHQYYGRKKKKKSFFSELFED